MGITLSTCFVDASESTESLVSIFHKTEISCNTLIIAIHDEPTEDVLPLFSGQAKHFQFDQELCRKNFLTQYLDHFLTNSLLTNETSQEVDGTETIDPVAQERRLRALIQADLAPLVSICKQLAPKILDKVISCSFGAPRKSAIGPAQATFNAMLNNSLPENELLCTAEDRSVSESEAPEFLDFQKKGSRLAKWETIETDLKQDNYMCQNSYCSKEMLQIILPTAGQLARFSKPSDGFRMSDNLILLRFLSVGRNKWHQLGPPSFHSRCTVQEKAEGKEDCDGKPERGTNEGICMSREDGHTWFPIQCVFNECGD